MVRPPPTRELHRLASVPKIPYTPDLFIEMPVLNALHLGFHKHGERHLEELFPERN